MDGVRGETRPHAPVEVADRSPRRLEEPDPIEQRPANQQLGEGDEDARSAEVQQAVERRPPHMHLANERAAAAAEHRIAQPPVRGFAPFLVDRPQTAVSDIARRVRVERRDHDAEKVRRHRVVAGRDVDVVAARLAKARRPASRRAFARALPRPKVRLDER
jgi:hypothetical protein